MKVWPGAQPPIFTHRGRSRFLHMKVWPAAQPPSRPKRRAKRPDFFT